MTFKTNLKMSECQSVDSLLIVIILFKKTLKVQFATCFGILYCMVSYKLCCNVGHCVKRMLKICFFSCMRFLFHYDNSVRISNYSLQLFPFKYVLIIIYNINIIHYQYDLSAVFQEPLIFIFLIPIHYSEYSKLENTITRYENAATAYET